MQGGIHQGFFFAQLGDLGFALGFKVQASFVGVWSLSPGPHSHLPQCCLEQLGDGHRGDPSPTLASPEDAAEEAGGPGCPGMEHAAPIHLLAVSELT